MSEDAPQDTPETTEIPEEVRAVHPFLVKLWTVLKPGSEGERYALPEGTLDEVYGGLLDYEGHAELPIILQQLRHLTVMMQTDFSSPTLAAQLLALLENEDIQRLGRDIKSTPQLTNLAERLTEFAGEDASKTAPTIDQEKPEGSIRIDQLKFPKRM